MNGLSIRTKAFNTDTIAHSYKKTNIRNKRASTPPTIITTSKTSKTKTFDFVENSTNIKSADDLTLEFIKQMKNLMKVKELENKLNSNSEKSEQPLINHRNHKRRNTIQNYKHCKKLQLLTHNRIFIGNEKGKNKIKRQPKRTFNIPKLDIEGKILQENKNKIDLSDNRYAIDWNSINSLTRNNLISFQAENKEIHSNRNKRRFSDTQLQIKMQSFASYASTAFMFNHYSCRWKNIKDIDKLSAMTTNRYRKEGLQMAKDIVRHKYLNMNKYVRNYPNISHHRFKKSLQVCYQILDHKPEDIRTSLNMNIFLPSLNIVFDETVQERAEKENQIETVRKRIKTQKQKKRRELEIKDLQKRIKLLKKYRKDMKLWKKTLHRIQSKDDLYL